jgi:hypothetical protein
MSDDRAIFSINRLYKLVTASASGPDWERETREACRDTVDEIEQLIAVLERQDNTEPAVAAKLTFFRNQLAVIKAWDSQQFSEGDLTRLI